MNQFIASLPKLPNSDEMALWDRAAIDFGISEFLLMENAGQACFEAIANKFGRPINAVVFMGGGNNGGDAACLARKLADFWAGVCVYHLKDIDKADDAAGLHAKLAMKDGVDFVRLEMDTEISASALLRSILAATGKLPDLIIDGLVGTGLKTALKPPLAKLIEAINELSALVQCPVVSIDIPSGLLSGTGRPSPVAVQATLTVTLAAAKPGLLVPAARHWVGELICLPIGIPRSISRQCPFSMRLLQGESLLQLPGLPGQSYKGTYGHVVIFGGWRGYAGAAHLASRSALRTGAGLVTVCAPGESLPLIKDGLPEVMGLPAMAGASWPHELSLKLIELLQKSSAMVIGPGMGRREEAGAFLRALLKTENRPPAIIDADALALLAGNDDMAAFITSRDILTPHPGEAAILLKSGIREVQEDRLGALAKLCQLYPATIVLKGAGTLVGKKGEIFLLSPYDIPQLAIGGSGDVLAGCMGALAGIYGSPEYDSMTIAGIGVAMHAMAGLLCDELYPDRGNLASQLADALPRVQSFVASQLKKKTKGAMPWPV